MSKRYARNLALFVGANPRADGIVAPVPTRNTKRTHFAARFGLYYIKNKRVTKQTAEPETNPFGPRQVLPRPLPDVSAFGNGTVSQSALILTQFAPPTDCPILEMGLSKKWISKWI
jgi:hypothetical protein